MVSAKVSSLGGGQYQVNIVNLTQDFSSPTETLSSGRTTPQGRENGLLRTQVVPQLELFCLQVDHWRISGTEQFSDCSIKLNNVSVASSIISDCQATAIGLTMVSSDGKTTYAQPNNLSSDGTSFQVVSW